MQTMRGVPLRNRKAEKPPLGPFIGVLILLPMLIKGLDTNPYEFSTVTLGQRVSMIPVDSSGQKAARPQLVVDRGIEFSTVTLGQKVSMSSVDSSGQKAAHAQQAVDEFTNVALGQRAWMSSVDSSGQRPARAQLAVDGDIGTEGQPFFCSSTDPTDRLWYRWWRVDLETDQVVHHLVLHTCCQGDSPAEPLQIRVAKGLTSNMFADPDKQAVQPADLEEVCLEVNDTLTSSGHQLNCTWPLLGRYVTVLQNVSSIVSSNNNLPPPLRLCEVQVYVAVTGKLAVPVLHAGQQFPTTACWPKMLCDSQTVCIEGVCKIRIGSPCTAANARHCHPDSVCDKDACRLKLGKDCEEYPEWCVTSTECEIGSRQCKAMAGEHCQTQEECVSGTMCSEKQCSRLPGAQCGRTLDCVHGAVCQGGVCVCHNSTAANDTCAPVPGVPGGECPCSANPKLHCVSIMCICDQSAFKLDRNWLSCSKDAGGQCNSDEDCITGTICETNQTAPASKTCRKTGGMECTRNSDLCSKFSVCEDDFCRLKAGEECTGHPSTHCQNGTVCDPTSPSSALCLVQVGHSCDSGSRQCVRSAVCDHGICKLRSGQSCFAEHVFSCHSGALCDRQFVCRSDVKGECNTQDDCALGLLCLKGICKIGADVSCFHTGDNCSGSLVCDHLNKCRLRIGADCGSLPHMCMCGATCQQSVCRCDTDVSVEKNGLCQPKDQMVGGYCSVSKPCLPRKAECDPVTSTCVCPPQHSVDQATLTCQLKPGDECISQTMACTLGDVCDYDGVCKINTGHSCDEADRQNLCRWGTSCDRGLCRIDLDHSCARHKDMCREHLVCDVLNVCKRPVGAGCSRRKQCPAGAMCSPDNKCTCVPRLASVNDTLHICEPLALKVGGQCWMGQREEPCEHPRASCYASRCRCQDNFVTDWNFSCYRPAGGSCEEEDDVCVSGTVCSSSTCKYRVGQMCHPLQPNLCVDSAICDVDFVCRLDFTSSCDSYDKHCRHEAVCDNTYRCMRGTGYNCSDEPTLCVAGSYCLDGLCTCLGSSRVEPSGTLCLPRAGRVTGRCNPGCVDPNAFCTKNDTCACKQAFVVNLRDYSCLSESPVMSGSSDDGTDDQWWWLSIMGGIVAMALVILAVSVGLKKKNEREMEIIEDIERTRERLFQLSLDVDQINAESRAKDVSVSDDSASSDRHRTDSDDSASSERLVFSKGSDISSHPSNASSDEESVNTLDSDESEM